MTNRTCSLPGCGKPHRARGLCASHYQLAHQPDRHPRYTITCETCGHEHQTLRKGGRFCSLLCRDVWRLDNPDSRVRAKADRMLPVLAEARWLPLPDRHPARYQPRPPRVWTAGPCAWCASPFVASRPEARYCSSACAEAMAAHRRRKRLGHQRLDLTHAQRMVLYVRDDWVCQLCDEAVDPALMVTSPNDDWAPSLDHIVTRASGGSDAPENLRLAHRWCNSIRGDGVDYTGLSIYAA